MTELSNVHLSFSHYVKIHAVVALDFRTNACCAHTFMQTLFMHT